MLVGDGASGQEQVKSQILRVYCPPPDAKSISAAALSGPGLGRAPLIHAQPGLAGPVWVVGGPPPGISRPPVSYPGQPMFLPPGAPPLMQMRGPPPPPGQFMQYGQRPGPMPGDPPPQMMRGPVPVYGPPRPAEKVRRTTQGLTGQ
ncbi:hypothetical protein RND81_12G145700 [Saponaria officinalis]|uniref:Uncharacterized protein n=1 Tax=Saponaria officinalis TaxID=3572 RepID=A0AAW1HAK7_SAPOF